MSDYVHIGKIVASHGLEGFVVLMHSFDKRTAFKKGQVLFIEENKGSYIPWFVESAKAKDNTDMYIKLEGINTKESTKKILQKKIWLNDSDFRAMVNKSSTLALLGFMVINENEQLSPIEEVIEQPHQVLLRITYNKREVLIPLHAETLDKIDHKKKEVHVVLPEGLLDVYLD